MDEARVGNEDDVAFENKIGFWGVRWRVCLQISHPRKPGRIVEATHSTISFSSALVRFAVACTLAEKYFGELKDVIRTRDLSANLVSLGKMCEPQLPRIS